MLGSSVSNHRRTSQFPVKELADIALRTAVGHADEPARATLFWEQRACKQTIAPNDSLLSISRPVPCASVAPRPASICGRLRCPRLPNTISALRLAMRKHAPTGMPVPCKSHLLGAASEHVRQGTSSSANEARTMQIGGNMGFFDGLLGHGTEVDSAKLSSRLDGVLIDGETAQISFKVLGDFFVFTDYRLILVDIQGVTGKKVEYVSIPYRSITRFSVETAGTFDLDAELKIWVSGDSIPIQKTLKKGTDVRGIQRAIATAIFVGQRS